MSELYLSRLWLVTIWVSCALALQACRQESFSERTLIGPFAGEPFHGELTTAPASSLRLSPELLLDVHWEGATNAPIIRLRDATGTSVWSRVLVARLEGQKEPRGLITALTLNEIKTGKHGFKVMLSCDWIGGGKEVGIIYLSTSYTFRSFSLGW